MHLEKVGSQILQNWATLGRRPNPEEWQQLEARELQDKNRCLGLGIDPENITELLQQRSHLFEAVVGEVGHMLGYLPVTTLWYLWIPLAMQLAAKQKILNRPLIQGILGGQGTGKTTMGKMLSLILRELGNRTLSLSIDDLYKTYAERQKLRELDPRLIWRGPPGTHDVELGLQVLDKLRQQPLKLETNSPTTPKLIEIPRFDKSAYQGAGDRTNPEKIDGAEIILFEGWFVGVRPVEGDIWHNAPWPIITESDRIFAQDNNQRLREYLPLWQRLDSLIVLYPVDYRLSLAWRKQAEHEMIASGKSGMSDAEIEQFVYYFWQALHPELFIEPLIKNPQWVDLVITINRDRSIGQIYSPKPGFFA
ncbi:glycerate kinase [Planktothricoides sp. SR001]|uniref:glycerate kinase n=1 Tax=Planktothricoides sp. SR001 TaxID=1705388 RepID=UPI000ACFED3E|nr:glycerate kinase [Planktothricoides sp. SR001]